MSNVLHDTPIYSDSTRPCTIIFDRHHTPATQARIAQQTLARFPQPARFQVSQDLRSCTKTQAKAPTHLGRNECLHQALLRHGPEAEEEEVENREVGRLEDAPVVRVRRQLREAERGEDHQHERSEPRGALEEQRFRRMKQPRVCVKSKGYWDQLCCQNS